MLRKIAAGLGASAFILAFSVPAFADSLTGVVHDVAPGHVTITLSNGKLKMMEVKKGVDVAHVAKGDMVEVALNSEDEILGAKVVKADKPGEAGAKKD